MAEESSGGSGIGFFIAFFVGIFFLWLVGNTGDGLVGRATSTATSARPTSSESISRPSALSQRGTSVERSFTHSPQRSSFLTQSRSNRSIESELSSAYRQVDELREDIREAKIWGVRSPYEDKVTLSRGSVTTDDVDQEYVRIRAHSGNDEAINISGWLLESYVTEEGGTIPFGTRLAYQGRVNDTKTILLEPDETAIITTGESPIGTSFHENMCTGYFNQFQDFSPGLSQSCPNPIDEMERFASIDLDNDNCYEYVERLPSCRLVLDEAVTADPALSNGCRNFIVNDLTYAGCVANHQYDPFFYRGMWHIYLNREDELWRREREIIKLVDRGGRTVDVIEY